MGWIKDNLSKAISALWTTVKVLAVMAFAAQMVLSSFYFYSNYRGDLNRAANAVRQYQMGEAAFKQTLVRFVTELRGLKQTNVDKVVNKYFPEQRKKEKP